MYSLEQLRDYGVLWMINRTLFHPRGYAMALNVDDNDKVVGWSLLGDGTEPWMYATKEAARHFGMDAPNLVDETEKFHAFMELLAEQTPHAIPTL